MLTLILLLTLLTNPSVQPPPQASVRMLTDGDGAVICTVSSINQELALWMTANHCLDAPVFIPSQHADGSWFYHEAIPIFNDSVNDVAVLHTPDLHVVGLRLSETEPVVDDPVHVWGFPLGWQDMQHFKGTVSNVATRWTFNNDTPFGPVSQDYGTRMTFQMAACNGNSGSVILDAANRVVSILQLGVGSGCSIVTGGVPYQELVRVAGKFFAR